ncbi:YceI family protein [Lysobacter solisilvae (ex Woo and Kim 2020)]|uniref:YceI family protein n=1 Tax=Agrilutibacter terrestris TaxID=2865112 RepID=A0A7H0FTR2_9GAMM|nr:YceI family protein [Lysobacter terrestris]QNP39428.1 YceI family protein [Lysobacter terrestris]
MLIVLVAVAGLLPATAGAQALDQARSRIDFDLETRWGQVITGHFPRYDGEVVELPDGRHEVRIRLATTAVEVTGSRRYTRFARGDRFLDAEHHPWVEFRSDPYAMDLLHAGGLLHGTLTMHGVSRREAFVLAPGTCARPARDCDVVAQGRVLRMNYGVESWRWALTDDVNFRLRVRVQAAPP